MPYYIGTSNEITEYATSCSIDAKIMRDNNITSQHEYRLFLQKNGKKAVRKN